jgi:hypothetical protein
MRRESGLSRVNVKIWVSSEASIRKSNEEKESGPPSMMCR